MTTTTSVDEIKILDTPLPIPTTFSGSASKSPRCFDDTHHSSLCTHITTFFPNDSDNEVSLLQQAS